MAGPWEKFAQPATPAPAGPWSQFQGPAEAPQAAPAQDKSYKGSILPFSVDAQGNASFDSDAGIIGAIKRAVTLPRDVYEGKVDLNNEPRHWSEPDPTWERVLEAGATLAPVNPAIRAGDAAIPGPIRMLEREKVLPPSVEALKAAADDGYTRSREMGVEYSSEAVRNLAGDIKTGLEMDGVLGELAPKSFRVLEKLESPPEGSTAPFTGLVAARRAFQNAGKDFNNPTDQLAAGRAKSELDAFLEGSDPAHVVAGPAAEAAKLYRDANSNYAAAMRSDKLHGIEEAADLRAAAANSGKNVDNAFRQRVASALLKNKETAGFSDEELAQLRKVVEGSWVGNKARTVGNILGGGGGLGASVYGIAGLSGTAATGNLGLAAAGIAAPVIGMGAKKLASTLTEGSFRKADDMVRMRSPLYQKLEAEAPLIAISPERRATLAKALMLTQFGVSPEEALQPLP